MLNRLRADGGYIRPRAERDGGVLRANVAKVLGWEHSKDRKTALRIETLLHHCWTRDGLFYSCLPFLARRRDRSGGSISEPTPTYVPVDVCTETKFVTKILDS